MKSKYVLAAMLVLSGFATEAAMAQQRVKIPITNKHPPRVRAIVERNTEPERNCTATPPGRDERRANPPFGRSGLPYCGGNPANQN
jgi:hypothetical protein